MRGIQCVPMARRRGVGVAGLGAHVGDGRVLREEQARVGVPEVVEPEARELRAGGLE